MAGDKNYLELLKKMEELHIKKNAGYSGDSVDRWANFREAEGIGVSSVLGVLVRMSDKWIRIKNLIKNPSNEQVGEAITDTLMDLASYALITICLLNEKDPNAVYQPNLVLYSGENYTIRVLRVNALVDCWYNKYLGETFRARWVGGDSQFVVDGCGRVELKDCVVINELH